MHLKDTADAAKKLAQNLPLPKKHKFGRSDITTLVLSFICALFLWVYIASSVTTDYSVWFYKLPVTYDLAGTRAESLELSLLPESEEMLESMTVDVNIKGTRAAYGALKRSDLEAYIDFDSSVSDIIGKQALPIRIRKVNGADIPSSDADLTVNYAEVEMDRYQWMDIPVNEVTPIQLSDEETRIDNEGITYEPSSVKIYGPSSLLSSLDHIRVNISAEEEITKTQTLSELTKYDILDQDGNVVNAASLKVQATRFSVRIPVYYSRKLPVSVKIINMPESFDEEAEEAIMQRIRITANDTEYTLPGCGDNNLIIKIQTDKLENKEKLDQREIWTIGSVPISSLAPGTSIKLPVNMEEGFEDTSNLGAVYVSLDGTDLETEVRWIKNSEIVQTNPDSRYDYELESPGGNTPITLIGTKEELSKIDSADLKASVNLINISVTTEGVYTQAFNVTLPDSASGVWVSPTPSVNIVVSLKNG